MSLNDYAKDIDACRKALDTTNKHLVEILTFYSTVRSLGVDSFIKRIPKQMINGLNDSHSQFMQACNSMEKLILQGMYAKNHLANPTNNYGALQSSKSSLLPDDTNLLNIASEESSTEISILSQMQIQSGKPLELDTQAEPHVNIESQATEAPATESETQPLSTEIAKTDHDMVIDSENFERPATESENSEQNASSLLTTDFSLPPLQQIQDNEQTSSMALELDSNALVLPNTNSSKTDEVLGSSLNLAQFPSTELSFGENAPNLLDTYSGDSSQDLWNLLKIPISEGLDTKLTDFLFTQPQPTTQDSSQQPQSDHASE